MAGYFVNLHYTELVLKEVEASFDCSAMKIFILTLVF